MKGCGGMRVDFPIPLYARTRVTPIYRLPTRIPPHSALKGTQGGELRTVCAGHLRRAEFLAEKEAELRTLFEEANTQRDAVLAPDRRMVELYARRRAAVDECKGGERGGADVAERMAAIRPMEEEMLALAPMTVAGTLVKLRIAAEDADPGKWLEAPLADAERLAPENWPEDYPPIQQVT